MNFIKEIIEDNKHILRNHGVTHLITIWAKLIGYLVITPIINILLLWKIWILGILFIPLTYLAYVIVFQGKAGIMKISIKLMGVVNKIFGWFKK